MQIGIVTVYKSDNYGAFLQAYALKNYLSMLGHDVFFIKHHARNINAMCLKKIIKKIMNHDTFGYVFQLKKRKIFNHSTAMFKEINAKHEKKLDLIIFGSDEIWNISRKNIRKYPLLFGLGFENKNKISYAPSINNSESADFVKNTDYINALKKMRNLSVRDNHSKTILEGVLGQEIKKVVDPTLLMDKSFYLKHSSKVKMEFQYVLVYSYGTNLEEVVIKEIKEYCKINNFKTVSILEHFDWCDFNIVATPFEMLSYFEKAEKIITDTFHGTVFSLIFNKDFVIASKGSTKIINLLQDVDLEKRIISNKKRIGDILDIAVPYNETNEKIEHMRTISEDFLNAALDEFDV